MNSWRFAWRECHRRMGRSMLSILSVLIAVAAIVAVASASRTARDAYERVFQALAGRADLEIVARGGSRFDESVVAEVLALPGIRAAVPIFHRATIVYAHGAKAKVMAAGIVPDEPESLTGFEIAKGAWPRAADEVALEATLAAALKLNVDDQIKLLTSRGLKPYRVSGLVALDSAVRLQQGGMVLAPIDHLRKAFRSPGEVDAMNLFLTNPHDTDRVIAAATPLVPGELRVRAPTARSGLAQETLLLTEVSLNMASALSFTTAVFITLSVFLMNVSERRRELSILRAIGATRRQIISMVCTEALLLGLVGTALGIPAGIFGGGLLTHSMEGILQVSLPEAPILIWPLILGGIFGPLLCLLASWYPALKAARVSPLEGMRPQITLPAQYSHRLTTTIGLAGTLATVVLAIFCVRGELPTWIAVGAVVLGLISMVLFLPLLLAPGLRMLAWPLGRWQAVEEEMSERLVGRHAGRSALTIGVLFIAVASGVGTGNSVFSITGDIRSWFERTIAADYLLRTMMPDMTGQDAVNMPESLRDELAAIPGIGLIDSVRFLRADVRGSDAILASRNFSLYDRLPLAVPQDEAASVLEKLKAGEAVVGSVLAERAGIHVGDQLEVTLGSETRQFRVAALASEYTFGGSVVYLDRETALKNFKLEGVDSFLIRTVKPTPPDVAARINAIAERDGLLLQSFGEVYELVDAMVSGVVGGLWILLALGLLVGALGVVNTLTMNVLEQTRELGMLRAVGMQRSQIIRIVLGEAGFIGALGTLLGGVAGITLAWSINLCLGALFGHRVEFAMRPQFVLTLLVAAMAVVMLASLVPALRAARLNPIQAMRQD